MNAENIQTPEILIQNGYQYINVLGEGSNGKTYKAKNLRTGEIVAVKALKFNENLKNYELFRREADVLKNIRIDGVPRYYDFIAQEDAFTECWLVQEYVEGKSLLDMLQTDDKLTEFESLMIMREVAKIVHQLQTDYAPPIIHRDIKPSNILVTGDLKEQFQVYLIDFGAVANPQKRTGGSTVAGTVGYMAPEQLMGDCAIQSDYYAIGATMLHLMTGTAPVDMPSDGFNLQYERILKAAVPDIRPETIALYKKLLAPKSQDRIADSGQLIAQINAAMLAVYNNADSKKRNQITKYAGAHLAKSAAAIFIKIVRLPIIAVGIMVAGFAFFASFSNFHDPDAMMICFLTCIASIALIALVEFAHRKLSKQRQESDDLAEIDVPMSESQKKLSASIEREMTSERIDIYDEKTQVVDGIVVDEKAKTIDCVFEINGQSCAATYDNTANHHVGDKVRILYTTTQNEYLTNLV